MTPEMIEKEKQLLKLAKVRHAGKALAEAAEALSLSPEDLIDIVVALAKKELSK